MKRRTLLALGSAGLLPEQVLQAVFNRAVAQQKPAIRYDVASPEGQAMLKIYAGAVQKMTDLANNKATTGDPFSWVFQWYTHYAPRPKNQEILRIYGAGSRQYRPLAEAAWNTCQAHGGGNEQENSFLPWHRMFVMTFEQIIRQVSGQQQFTLPYWNYTDANNRAIPPQFRNGSDPMFGTLYRQNRNPGVNQGQPIDQGINPTPINLDAMKSPTYGPDGADQGFCANLDGGLHGSVHDLVGNDTNMGYVPTAGGDPVFWMHHCNIDRVWASWNKAGGQNVYDDLKFTFAGPQKTAVTYSSKSVSDTVPLGYVYDNYLTPPAPSGTQVAALAARPHAAPPAPTTIAASTNVSVATAARPVTVHLTHRTTLKSNAVTPQSSQRVFLVLRDFKVARQPAVIYSVYLNDASGRQGPYVGAINFFGAMAPMAGMNMGAVQRGVSFDITGIADAAHLQAVSLTFVPHGQPAAGSAPQVGSVTVEVQ